MCLTPRITCTHGTQARKLQCLELKSRKRAEPLTSLCYGRRFLPTLSPASPGPRQGWQGWETGSCHWEAPCRIPQAVARLGQPLSGQCSDAERTVCWHPLRSGVYSAAAPLGLPGLSTSNPQGHRVCSYHTQGAALALDHSVRDWQCQDPAPHRLPHHQSPCSLEVYLRSRQQAGARATLCFPLCSLRGAGRPVLAALPASALESRIPEATVAGQQARPQSRPQAPLSSYLRLPLPVRHHPCTYLLPPGQEMGTEIENIL